MQRTPRDVSCPQMQTLLTLLSRAQAPGLRALVRSQRLTLPALAPVTPVACLPWHPHAGAPGHHLQAEPRQPHRRRRAQRHPRCGDPPPFASPAAFTNTLHRRAPPPLSRTGACHSLPSPPSPNPRAAHCPPTLFVAPHTAPVVTCLLAWPRRPQPRTGRGAHARRRRLLPRVRPPAAAALTTTLSTTPGRPAGTDSLFVSRSCA